MEISMCLYKVDRLYICLYLHKGTCEYGFKVEAIDSAESLCEPQSAETHSRECTDGVFLCPLGLTHRYVTCAIHCLIWNLLWKDSKGCSEVLHKK